MERKRVAVTIYLPPEIAEDYENIAQQEGRISVSSFVVCFQGMVELVYCDVVKSLCELIWIRVFILLNIYQSKSSQTIFNSEIKILKEV